jgi:hypothetical protein
MKNWQNYYIHPVIVLLYIEMENMPRDVKNKKELDRIRNQWRKKHRILNGKIILWPDKPPEHVNARASKTYNWFWKNILLNLNQQDIPAIISNIKEQISYSEDLEKIRMYRTMIGMAEDAYKLKDLDEIMNYDTQLMYENKPVYNSETGIVYRNGKIFTTDYSEDESEILVRDVEGILVDRLGSGNGKAEKSVKKTRVNTYKDWDYLEQI